MRLMSSENLNPSLLSFFASILIELKGFMIIAFYLNRLCRWCQEILEKILPESAKNERRRWRFFQNSPAGAVLAGG